MTDNGQKGSCDVQEQSRLPEPAYNLARRLMAVAKQNNNRVRVMVDVLIIDGEWWADIQKPGQLERLGE